MTLAPIPRPVLERALDYPLGWARRVPLSEPLRIVLLGLLGFLQQLLRARAARRRR